MQLILAIDADRQQADQLANLVAQRLSAELVQATSAGEALQALGDRVPDLILTSLLLSPFDDGVLAEYLRELGPAAGHVQTIRIPVLGSPKPSARGRFLFGRKRRGQVAPDGCDPKVFADEIAAYLARAAEERQAMAESQRRLDLAEPEGLVEDTLVYTPAYAPEPEAPRYDVDPAEFALPNVEEQTPIYVAPESTFRDDGGEREQLQDVTALDDTAAYEPPLVAPTYVTTYDEPSPAAVIEQSDSAVASPQLLTDVEAYEPLADEPALAAPAYEPVAGDEPVLAAQAREPEADHEDVPVVQPCQTVLNDEAAIGSALDIQVESAPRAVEEAYDWALHTRSEPIADTALGATAPDDLIDAGFATPPEPADDTVLAADASIVADEELFVLDTAPLAAGPASALASLEAGAGLNAPGASLDEPYVLQCVDEGVTLPVEMLAHGVPAVDEPVPLPEPEPADSAVVSRGPDEIAPVSYEAPPAPVIVASEAEPAGLHQEAATQADAPRRRRTPAFEAALAAIRKAWGKSKKFAPAPVTPPPSAPESPRHSALEAESPFHVEAEPAPVEPDTPPRGTSPAPVAIESEIAMAGAPPPLPIEEPTAAAPVSSDEPLVTAQSESRIESKSANEIDLTWDIDALEDPPIIEVVEAEAEVPVETAPQEAVAVPSGIDDDVYELSASPAFHDLESDLAAAAPPPVVREPIAEVEAIDPGPDERREPGTTRKARKAKKRPDSRQPAKPPKPNTRPVQDEWGLFDPNRCGFAALVEKLNEVTDEDDPKANKTTVRVISYR